MVTARCWSAQRTRVFSNTWGLNNASGDSVCSAAPTGTLTCVVATAEGEGETIFDHRPPDHVGPCRKIPIATADGEGGTIFPSPAPSEERKVKKAVILRRSYCAGARWNVIPQRFWMDACSIASICPLRRASSAVFSSLPLVNSSAGQKMIKPTPIAVG